MEYVTQTPVWVLYTHTLQLCHHVHIFLASILHPLTRRLTMQSTHTIHNTPSHQRPWLVVQFLAVIMVVVLLMLLNACSALTTPPHQDATLTRKSSGNSTSHTDPVPQHIDDQDIIDRAATIYHDVPDDTATHGTVISAQGHTLLIDDKDNNEQVGIRLIGVNVPTDSDAERAQHFIDQRIQPGSPVVVQYDPDIPSNQNRDPNNLDYFQAYVWFHGSSGLNRMLNAELLAGGWAEHTQLTTGYTYSSEFKKLESEAQDNKLGLWAN